MCDDMLCLRAAIARSRTLMKAADTYIYLTSFEQELESYDSWIWKVNRFQIIAYLRSFLMGSSTDRYMTSSIFVFSNEQSRDTSLSVCFYKEEQKNKID